MGSVTRQLQLISCLLIAVSLNSQTTPGHRPRIALVLEGGGALGFAHIGVIRYLEEHRIPVDLVVGTSMGGLVAGFYATGQSAAQIEQLTKEIDWDQVMSGWTAFQDLSYRRKEDRVAFPNRLEFGLKNKKLRFPSGLNSGHQTGLVIDRAVLAYSNEANFDKLPIPFRCVATDITEGREKVFGGGSIADALRATMAIPGVFAPVTVNGHTYADGGAVDNLPVDVARAAGAEIVIAVYLDAGPPDISAYDSFLSLAARNVSIMVSANELRNIAAADVLISADLHGFASFSFNSGHEIIPRGYAAAQKKREMLAKLALDERQWQAYLSERDSRIRKELPVPQFVEVRSNNAYYSESLKESLEKYAAKPIDEPKLEASLTRLTGTGVMSSVGYSLVYRQGRPGLEVQTYEKNYGPPLLDLGFAINGANPDNVLFGMFARLTFINVGTYRAEWRNDAFFGSTYGVRSEYYLPFSRTSKWFVAPHVYAISDAFNTYSGQDRTAQYRIEHDGLGADIGYEISPRSEVRVGQDLLWLKTIRKISSDPFPNLSEREGLTSMTYRYLGADNTQIPRSGLTIEAGFNWNQLRADLESFPQASLRSTFFLPVSKRGSLLFAASGGTTFGVGTAALGLQSFSLGGPLRLGAYGQNEVLANQFVLAQSGYEHKILPLSPLVGEGLYAIGLIEVGKVYGNSTVASTLPYDGTIALAARTVIGPVFFGGSLGNDNHRKWWFGVGRIF